MLWTVLLRIGGNGMIDSSTPRDFTQERTWKELEEVLRRYIERRIRIRADVDDVLQNTLLRIHRGLPSLRDNERFGPWVYALARSAVADYTRSVKRHPLATHEPPDVDLQLDESEDAAEDTSEERELAVCAAAFVGMLPSPYREALTLTELEGLTQKQAAEMFGISVSAMKSRVQRGREKLRTILERCCDISLDARGRVLSYKASKAAASGRDSCIACD